MTEEDSLSLQQDIDTISWWSALNSLSINPNKCKVLSLSRKRDPVVPSCILNGHELVNVNDITLLGVESIVSQPDLFVCGIHYRSILKTPLYAEVGILFTSSVLNLAELVALRPDLSRLTKIVYFHENQLVYPVRKQKDRDFQYGYNQIITCLTADIVLFNSKYNMESFLSSIGTFLKLMPDFRPKGLAEKIRPKSKVLYFPIEFPIMNDPIADVMEGLTLAEQASSLHGSQELFEKSKDRAIKSGVTGEQTVYSCSSVLSQLSSPLKIVWAHRWEHDKNPDLFFRTLYKLLDSGEDFRISVLGEHYSEIPDIFTEAYESLKDNIVHWGYQQSKEDYYQVLIEGDVAVSTAKHEFYGVAM
ncbi:tRNA-queuosine alpha-mannosyltransferase-like [Antedon mediterranea]|uniref:tRNA-queuosine alpha-mannosyltransferase-like n=1 Tax=Antedon mediterranea TaxID=105859 RepID=UPI003AF9F4E3